MQPEFQSATEEEIAEIDATYRPIPDFREWPREPQRPELWDRAANELAARSADVDESQLKAARETVLRAAAFETGAIEGLYSTDRGLTLTVATQAAGWEEAVQAHSEDALAYFEAQRKTLDLILDATTKKLPKVTEAWIRRLHDELTAPQETYLVQTAAGPQQQPLPRGEYKRYPNHVRTPDGDLHAYAPVHQTPPEMERLIAELDSASFKQAHAAVQAAYAHYCIAAIHPFADGNGRVARALASVYLFRAASVPLLVLADRTGPYRNALAAADGGSYEPFAQLVEDASRSAIEMATASMLEASAPKPEIEMQAFSGLYIAQENLTHEQLQQTAMDALQRLQEITQQAIGALPGAAGISISATVRGGANQTNPPDGFRSLVSGPVQLFVHLGTQPPAQAQRSHIVDLFVSARRDPSESIRFQHADDVGLTFGLHDIYPSVSLAAEHQMRAYIRYLLGNELAAIRGEAEQALKNSGYGLEG